MIPFYYPASKCTGGVDRAYALLHQRVIHFEVPWSSVPAVADRVPLENVRTIGRDVCEV